MGGGWEGKRASKTFRDANNDVKCFALQNVSLCFRCYLTVLGQHGLTDKASDFESEDWGFESLGGRLFIIKSCAVFLDKPLKTVQILRGF